MGAGASAEPYLTGKEGDRVKADYHGNGKLYAGEIVRCNSNGTFDIRYDDGDLEKGVRGQNMRSIHLPTISEVVSETSPHMRTSLSPMPTAMKHTPKLHAFWEILRKGLQCRVWRTVDNVHDTRNPNQDETSFAADWELEVMFLLYDTKTDEPVLCIDKLKTMKPSETCLCFPLRFLPAETCLRIRAEREAQHLVQFRSSQRIKLSRRIQDVLNPNLTFAIKHLDLKVGAVVGVDTERSRDLMLEKLGMLLAVFVQEQQEKEGHANLVAGNNEHQRHQQENCARHYDTGPQKGVPVAYGKLQQGPLRERTDFNTAPMSVLKKYSAGDMSFA